MDPAKKASQTRHYNFHSHTQFCDGRATMAEFADAAVEAGILHYGFSPHSPLKEIESPCNMKFEDVEPFLYEVERLRQIYNGKISLYAAMEVDFIDDSWGPANTYFSSLPLDYTIGSVHFIPSDSGFIDIDGRFENFRIKMEKYFTNDIRHVVETFYRQSTRMIELGGFDILGHFDKIGHNASHFSNGIEDKSWYRALVYDLIDLIAEKNLTVEINTKAWSDHHRMFPGEYLLKRLFEKRIQIIVNSDAHYPHLIEASRNEAFGMLQRAGYQIPDAD